MKPPPNPAFPEGAFSDTTKESGCTDLFAAINGSGSKNLTVKLKNAYRVLLTRARQGMIIVVPDGDPKDPTRDTSFYDPTFEYLSGIGFKTL